MRGRGRICAPGTWGAEYYPGFEPRDVPDGQPGRTEYVVTKHRYSGFIGTDLDLILRSLEVKSLIMVGVASNNCVEATARVFGRTGVEMEALTAVSVAALTVYDMCKAVDRTMTIERIRLEEKSGGRSGTFRRGD